MSVGSDFIKGISIKFDGNTTELNKALKDVNTEANRAQDSLRAVNYASKFDTRNSTLLAEKQKLLQEQYAATTKKVQTLKEADKVAVEGMKNGTKGAAEAHRKLQKDIAIAEGKERRLGEAARLAAFQASRVGRAGLALKSYGAQINGLGQKMSRLSMGAGVATAGMVKLAVDAEDNFSKVNSILGLSGDEWQAYQNSLKKGARNIHKSYSEYADAAYQAISASVPQAHVNEFLAKSAQLAKGGMTDMTTATDLLTTVINAYGMKTSDAAHINDVLLQTQNNGKTTVAQLGASMGKVIPIASSLGVSVEELGAQYSILTNRGIRTRMASTYIKSMLTELSKNGSKADKTLRQLTGKGFSELIKGGKTTGDVLQMLKKAANKNGQSLKDMFANTNATSGALALMKVTVKGYNRELDIMNNSNGIAARAAAEMSQTTGSQLKRALNDAKNAAVDFGATVLPVITPLIRKAAELADKFSNLSDGQKKFAAHVLLGTTVLSPLLKGIGGLATGAGNAIGGIGKLSSKLGGMSKAAAGGASASSGLISVIGKAGAWGVAAAGVGILTLAIIHNIRKQHELERAARQAANERIKNVNDAKAEAAANEVIANDELARLDKLAKKRHKSVSDTVEIKTLVGDLNERVKGLNLRYDENTGKLNKNTAAIKRQIKAIKDQAMAEALKENLKSASQDYAKALMKEQDAKQRLIKAEKNYKKAVLMSGGSDMPQARLAYGNLLQAKNGVDDATSAVKKNKKEVSKWSDVYTKETGKIARVNAFDDLVKKSKISADKIPEELKKGIESGRLIVPASVNSLKRYITFADAAKKAGIEAKDIPENIANGILTGKTTIKEAQNRLYGHAKKGAEKIGKAQGVGVSKGVISTRGIVHQAGEAVKKAAEKGASGSLKKAGAKTAGSYPAGVRSKASAVYSAAVHLVLRARAGASGSLKPEGGNVAKGYADGIDAYASRVANSARNMVRRAMAAAKHAQDSHSPSKKFRQIAGMASEGYSLGLTDNNDNIKNAARKMVGSALSASATTFQPTVALGSSRGITSGNNTTNTRNNTFNISMTVDGATDPGAWASEFASNLKRQVMAGG